MDMGHEHNIGQANNGDGGKEVLATKVENLDAKLRMGEGDYDFEMEGDDKK